MRNMKRVEKSSPMSDDAVKAKTGKSWSEWFAVLDSAGAKKMNHTEIAAYLYDKKRIPGWWSQMVAVGYERARGMREKYERPEGYQISVSRTIAASARRVYEAWKDKKTRSLWLVDTPIVIRKATPIKSMRITWVDGQSSLEVNFYSKAKNKSQVVVQHSKLPNAKDAEKKKSYWGENLDRLKMILEV